MVIEEKEETKERKKGMMEKINRRKRRR